MFNLIRQFLTHNNTESNTMARTKQYVVYTREFTKGNVNSKIGVFVEPANSYMVNGSVNGGAIKFANLKMKRSTATKKLLDSGYDFSVRVLGTSSLQGAMAMKSQIVDLLSNTNKTVINQAA
tara:strand:- start:31 stop:396 length:366 start_codon:yes stop_codon:yes gene_type:complete